METNKIELSQEQIEDMFYDGRAYAWAKNVFNKVDLSEEEKSFSETINSMTAKMYKYGNTQAKDEISELVTRIIEPEVFGYPVEILGNIFAEGDGLGEFDKMKVKKSPRNTLIARQSAPRTGNVDMSYIDFTEGNVAEFHLQIETKLAMSDLRRDGAMGIATLAMYAVEEFNAQKFKMLLDYADKLITAGGSNYFPCAGTMTKSAIDEFTGYLDDNNFTGKQSEVVGLSNRVRELCKTAGVDYLSDNLKEVMNNTAMLQVYGNASLVPIKAGKTTGDGSKLLATDRLYGFAGQVGEMYTKGEMRSMTDFDNKGEKIHLKFTGVEFGVCITKPEKIAKLVVTA
jgi:hypothetical protein